MTKLTDHTGKLPYHYYQKTLQELTCKEWVNLPPEVKLANLFADFGYLSDNQKYYEFTFNTNKAKKYISRLETTAKELGVELHHSAAGLVYSVPVIKDVDEILEYFC